jgi:hypothetical protein
VLKGLKRLETPTIINGLCYFGEKCDKKIGKKGKKAEGAVKRLMH